MRNKKKSKKTENNGEKISHDGDVMLIQGHNLESFLTLLHRAIESAKQLHGVLPPTPKLWFKQQFCIGVNEVTRTLENMNSLKPNLHLQAIIVAADCNPKWMTKHVQTLASTRNVPLILVKHQHTNDDKTAAASFKLGQLVNLKTAIAIGIKAKANPINQIIDRIIQSKDLNFEETLLLHCQPS